MIEQILQKDIYAIEVYEKEFGPLPSTFAMLPAVLNRLPEICRNAVSKGQKLTNSDLKISEVPEGALI